MNPTHTHTHTKYTIPTLVLYEEIASLLINPCGVRWQELLRLSPQMCDSIQINLLRFTLPYVVYESNLIIYNKILQKTLFFLSI